MNEVDANGNSVVCVVAVIFHMRYALLSFFPCACSACFCLITQMGYISSSKLTKAVNINFLNLHFCISLN